MGIEGQGNKSGYPSGQEPVDALVGKRRPVAHAGKNRIISSVGQGLCQCLCLFICDGQNRGAAADFCVIGTALHRPFAGNTPGDEFLQEKRAKPDYAAVGKKVVEKGLNIF